MANFYPGSIPAALLEMGSRLGDYDADGSNRLFAGSTDSRIQPARAVDALDHAQQSLYDDYVIFNADKGNLALKITLTANASDTQEFDLPSRVSEVLKVTDSDMDDVIDDAEHWPISHALYPDTGYRLERGNTRLRFFGDTPDSNLTYYAKVLRRPPHLSYGTVGGTADSETTVMLAATPTYGYAMLRNDDYNGAEIAIVTDGGTNAAVGTYQEITDYVGSTRVAHVGTAWSFSAADLYSIIFSLPEPAWRAIILRACVLISRHFKGLSPEDIEDLKGEAETAFQRSLAMLQDPLPGSILRPRHRVELWH